jgi:hypothetical protein
VIHYRLKCVERGHIVHVPAPRTFTALQLQRPGRS